VGSAGGVNVQAKEEFGSKKTEKMLEMDSTTEIDEL